MDEVVDMENVTLDFDPNVNVCKRAANGQQTQHAEETNASEAANRESDLRTANNQQNRDMEETNVSEAVDGETYGQ